MKHCSANSPQSMVSPPVLHIPCPVAILTALSAVVAALAAAAANHGLP